MALLGNYSVILKSPATRIGGTAVSNCRNAFNETGQLRQRYYPDCPSCGSLTAGLPQGYLHPYSWLLPYEPGALSSTGIDCTATASATGQNGLAATADIAGIGSISDAAAGLIVELLATIAADGGLTASVIGQLEAAATLAGDGTLTGAQAALAGMVAALVGTGLVSDAQQEALGEMVANILVNEVDGGVLTVQQIVDGLKPDLTIINEGVQKSSLLVPHTEDLT